MADSPGRLLSSICLGGGGGGGGGYGGSSGSNSGSSGQSAKYGCVNIFLHLFDWNRRLSKRGLFFSKKLLPSTLDGAGQTGRRRKRRRNSNGSKAMVVAEDRLPMAKLLLIADENHCNCTARDEDEDEDEGGEQEQEQEEEEEDGNEGNEEDGGGGGGELDTAAVNSSSSSGGNQDNSRRNSTSSERFFPCSSEIRSLQELLHTDHDHDDCPPRMLHEFLIKPTEQKPLFSLLLEEAKSAFPDQAQQSNKVIHHHHQSPNPLSPRPRKKSSNSLARQVSSVSRRANSRKSSSSSPLGGSSKSRKCPGAASVASVASVGVASSGCGGFSRRTSGLFLEAAAKILDPRGHSSKPLTRVLPPGSSRKKTSERKVAEVEHHVSVSDDLESFGSRDEERHTHRRSFELLPPDIRLSSATTRSVSAPCSPRSRGGEGSIDYASCASIRSLMELFLDELEEDLELSHLSGCLLSPPRYQQVTERTNSPSSFGRSRSIHLPEKAEEVPKPVSVDDLNDDDYISFRDFLTASSSSAKLRRENSTPPPEVDEETSTFTDMTTTTSGGQDCCGIADPQDSHGFMVHNPLFDDSVSLDNYSELNEHNEDDQGLEDILKSILTQASDQAKQQRDSSRMTWVPDANSNLAAPENFSVYNNTNNNSSSSKDGSSSCSDESHQMDSDSVEVTSESNCGEDCGQPSPVSVLDSPFDDELPGKRGRRGPSSSSKTSRKRLEFSDEHQTPNTPTSSTSSSSSIDRFQTFDTDALEEAEGYISMILEESGISYHANVMMLLVAEAKNGCSGGDFSLGIISGSVFERLEDRMRVQQLIEHLESCSTSSRAEERPSHHSLGSLRAHYQSYHESRSRRRMVFDFVNEILSSIIGKHLEDHNSRIISGEQLVHETRQRAVEWKRQAFEGIHQLVDMEMSRVSNSSSINCSREVRDIGLSCAQHIFKSMMEELAMDLLDFHENLYR